MSAQEPGRHVAGFYRSEADAHEMVAGFLAAALARGHVLVVIAVPLRWQGVSARLERAGHDVARLEHERRILVWDADAVLARIRADGACDTQRLLAELRAALRIAGQEGHSVSIYGQVADLLCAAGEHETAIRLERQYGEAFDRDDVSVLCAYHLDSFATEPEIEAFEQICRCHHTVLPNGMIAGEPAGAGTAGALQQRTQALEAEIERRRGLEQQLHDARLAQERTARELRDARDELARAHRVKSEFIAVMSHELRTPLNAILGYRELLAMEVGGPVSADQQVFLGRIQRAANQLLSLIDQVLNVARIEAGGVELQHEEVDVAASAREVAAMMRPIARARGLELTVDAAGSALCECDPVKLRQILLNLVSNAVKFTKHGVVEVGVREEADTITVEVRDTGVGIAAPDLSRIFDRFVQLDRPLTRRHEGTGLGLSVCRDLARLMGAELSVQSTPGVGSAFSLLLAKQARPPSPRTPGSTGSARRNRE